MSGFGNLAFLAESKPLRRLSLDAGATTIITGPGIVFLSVDHDRHAFNGSCQI
jgi:hypothetical protein